MPIFYSATSSFDELQVSSSVFVSGSYIVSGTLDISSSMLIGNFGIRFRATAVSSSNVNTLDDYEEGSWTPAFNTNLGGTFTYANQTGTYTKIGNLVCVSFNVTLSNGTYSSVGSTTGLTVTGLPFLTRNTSANFLAEIACNTSAPTSTSVNIWGQTLGGGASTIVFYRATAATSNPLGTSLFQNAMGATGYIQGTMTYTSA